VRIAAGRLRSGRTMAKRALTCTRKAPHSASVQRFCGPHRGTGSRGASAASSARPLHPATSNAPRGCESTADRAYGRVAVFLGGAAQEQGRQGRVELCSTDRHDDEERRENRHQGRTLPQRLSARRLLLSGALSRPHAQKVRTHVFELGAVLPVHL